MNQNYLPTNQQFFLKSITCMALSIGTILISSSTFAGGSIFGGNKHKTANPNGVFAISEHVCSTLECPPIRIVEGKCDGEHMSLHWGVCVCDEEYTAKGDTCIGCTTFYEGTSANNEGGYAGSLDNGTKCYCPQNHIYNTDLNTCEEKTDDKCTSYLECNRGYFCALVGYTIDDRACRLATAETIGDNFYTSIDTMTFHTVSDFCKAAGGTAITFKDFCTDEEISDRKPSNPILHCEGFKTLDGRAYLMPGPPTIIIESSTGDVYTFPPQSPLLYPLCKK